MAEPQLKVESGFSCGSILLFFVLVGALIGVAVWHSDHPESPTATVLCYLLAVSVGGMVLAAIIKTLTALPKRWVTPPRD